MQVRGETIRYGSTNRYMWACSGWALREPADVSSVLYIKLEVHLRLPHEEVGGRLALSSGIREAV